MCALVLDTAVLIDTLRGRPAAARLRELASRREVLLTTAVNVEEIARGLRPSSRLLSSGRGSALYNAEPRFGSAKRTGTDAADKCSPP